MYRTAVREKFCLSAMVLSLGSILCQAQFTHEKTILSNGGQFMTGTSFNSHSVVGHSFSGSATSPGYVLESGFFTGTRVEDIPPPNEDGPAISQITFASPYDLGSDGFNITARVTSDVGVSSVIITFRGALTGESSQLAMTDSDGDSVYEVVIPNSEFKNQGLFFIISAVDINDRVTNATGQFVGVTPSQSPPDITSMVGNGTLNTDYRIITIPFTGTTVNSVFEELTDSDLDYRFDWRMFSYSNTFQDKSSGGFNVGEGYMILTKDRTTITINTGSTVRANVDEPFTKPLRDGWNLIGNPFTGRISWSAVLTHNVTEGNIADGDVTELYTFNGSYTTNDQNLAVFQGAFVRAPNGARNNFEIPVSAVQTFGRILTKTSPDKSYFLDPAHWKLKFNLSGGEYQYTLSGIGMHSDARDGADTKDHWTPPRFINYLEANIENFEQGGLLSQNIINGGNEHTWDFIIQTNIEDKVDVTWDNTVSRQLPGYLLLREIPNGRILNMKTTNNWIVHEADGKKFQVIYTQTLSEQLSSAIESLGDGYPNPFVEETSIPVEIIGSERSYYIKLDILSLEGRVVKTLIDRDMETGSHIINWNGDDNNGASLANGLYLYRLIYDNRHFPLKKLILQK